MVLLTCDSSIFLSGLILYQSEIENSEIDCQPKAYHSAHDGVGNQVFSLEQAALAEYLLQCFKWHKGGVFLWADMTHGTIYYVCCAELDPKTGICLRIQSHFYAILPSLVISDVFELWKFHSLVNVRLCRCFVFLPEMSKCHQPERHTFPLPTHFPTTFLQL